MRNRSATKAAPLSVQDEVGSPVQMTGFQGGTMMLVHQVPVGQTHRVAIKITNTSGSTATITGNVGRAQGCVIKLIKPRSSANIGPFTMVGGQDAVIEITTNRVASSLWVDGSATIQVDFLP